MRVVIVLLGNSQPEAHDADDGFELPNVWLGQHRITVLDIRDRSELSPFIVFDLLRSLKEKCLSFSAVYLNALWGRGLQLRMGSSNLTNLDCLLVAREGYKRKLVMVSCFVELKTQFVSSACPKDELYNFIASALLLDAYPPEMYLFEPNMVFNALYRAYCWKAWERGDAEIACNKVLYRFIGGFVQLRSKASADIRHESLVQPPEHMLPYRHAICDNCVIIYRTKCPRTEYHIDLPKCPICDKAVNLTIRQLLPTKGPIVLSLDRGGVRGIVQLGLLRALESRIGGISIAHIADLFARTSVGKSIRDNKDYTYD
ncbi:hypothetical protein N7536_009084 [Penicillium majusculum]|nr:hypothetical protein N7536_009084 [Penicillium majusculum]